MAESDNTNNISNEDTLDINELAALNNDISDDFISQLQDQVSKNAQEFANPNDDSNLFEEVPQQNNTPPKETELPSVSTEREPKSSTTLNSDLDDNFIKKYKAKLMKQQNANQEAEDQPDKAPVAEEQVVENNPVNIDTNIKTPVKGKQNAVQPDQDIEKISGGNITERKLDYAQVEYKESLDYLDNNTKYSKYVIYIDPENKEFIDSLTVKERKNLINRIIREQDDIAVTKKRLSKTQTILTHAIIAIITVTIAIPAIYWIINASLEATINNYRSSQSMFQTLYKERGKIKTNSK